MDLTTIPLDEIINNGIFAFLFVWLLYHQQKDSKSREEKLMNHLTKTTETLDVLSKRMENVNVKVHKIDNRLNKFEEDVKQLKGE
jgi:chromosome segregation ATPase